MKSILIFSNTFIIVTFPATAFWQIANSITGEPYIGEDGTIYFVSQIL